MKQIDSAHNEVFKHLKQLATTAKHRRRSGQTLLEGVHLCQSYLSQIGQPQTVVFTDKAAENAEVAKIIEGCEASKKVLLGEANFRAISNVEHGVGIVFVVDAPQLTAPTRLKQTALLLESIQDPGNLGAILRTAAAADVNEIYVSGGSVSAWSPKVTRAGMGAHFALKIYENCDLASLIKNSDVPVLATSLSAKKSIYQQDLSVSTAWLFGNEGSGVSTELLALNVQPIIIPQNPNIESLNVAAAVAVCLFEQNRQASSKTVQ